MNIYVTDLMDFPELIEHNLYNDNNLYVLSEMEWLWNANGIEILESFS